MRHRYLVRKVSHLQPVTFFRFLFGRDLGTVGAVALDSEGNVAYATSTGGIVNKMAGRVGDTPCVGSVGDDRRPRCPSPVVRFSVPVLCPSLFPSSFRWQFQNLWEERQLAWQELSGARLCEGVCTSSAPCFSYAACLGERDGDKGCKVVPKLPMAPLSSL